MKICKCITTMVVVVLIGGLKLTSVQAVDHIAPDLLPAFAQAVSADVSSEYQITPNGDGYQAANSRQGFVGEFMKDRVQIRQTGGTGVWTMTLTGLGYGTVQPVPTAMLWAEGTRVEYRRGTDITEWYVNSPVGLEQGLTLQVPPIGRERNTPLQVAFMLDGAAEFDGYGIVFQTVDGQTVFGYSGLVAWDADGQSLPAQMVLEGQTVRWVVQDQGARYPVTIDPWVQQTKLTAADGAEWDRFGSSVAVSGETAVIGTPHAAINGNANQGAAYVFVRSGASWGLQAKLTASDGWVNGWFGYSVAISGDTAVVSATGTNPGVYVFVRSGTSWTQQAKLPKQTPLGTNDSVGIDGDTVVIGVADETVGGNFCQGAAYVFVRNGGTWTEQQKLTASDGAANDQFGYSVGINGETVIIGAPYVTVGGNANQGAAYVFVRSGTSWPQHAKLTASDGGVNSWFGSSAAASGNTVLVGAHPNRAAYTFVRSGTSWIQQAKLTASDSTVGDRFGISVSLSGDMAVVGAELASIGSNTFQGAAYVFGRSGTTWSQQSKLTANDGAGSDNFGNSVSLSGDTAVVGAYCADVGGQSNQGAAYAFAGTEQSGNSYLLWTR